MKIKMGVKNLYGSKKGIALIIAYMILGVLAILVSSFMLRSISEKTSAEKNKDTAQALYAAEAGLQDALYRLKNVSWDTTSISTTNLSENLCQYSVSISGSGTQRTITSVGTVIESGITRNVEAVVARGIPPDFWGNSIYVAGEFETNGNAYDVNGKVVYGGEAESTNNFATVCNEGPCGVANVTNTAETSLPKLDFAGIKAVAQAQGNYYDAARIDRVKKGQDSYPASFWNNSPTNTIPNMIYVEGNLALNGTVSAGGFFVVVGNVLTDPDATADTTINGNGTVDGLIYTTGEFKINGGGGGLNVNGGVWAGSEAELKGNSTVSYNSVYQDAVKSQLDENESITIIGWREV